jgi:hypothetical protein
MADNFFLEDKALVGEIFDMEAAVSRSPSAIPLMSKQ